MPRATNAKQMTLEEYLAFEETAKEKHEFVDGFVFAMAGGTEAHNLISGNMFTALKAAARSKLCRTYIADIKLRVPEGHYYPDIFVSCAEDEFGESLKTKACLIVEVLSQGTADIDRGEKLLNYRKLVGLKAYVLVSQDKKLVEVYRYLTDGSWRYEVFEEGKVDLPCLDISLSFADLYEDVDVV